MEQPKEISVDKEVEEHRNKGALMLQEAKLIIVNDPVSEKKAADLMAAFKAKRDRVREFIGKFLEPTISKLHQAHREATTSRSALLAPFDNAVNLLSGSLSQYKTKLRQEQEAADRRAEAERKRQEDAERKRLEEQAAKAQAAGKEEKAQALQEEAAEVYIPPKEVNVGYQKTIKTQNGNVTSRTETAIEIVDENLLLKAVASGLFSKTFVEIKPGNIVRWARASGIKRQDMHGLRIFQKEVVR